MDLIDRLRAAVPAAIEEAQRVLRERQRTLAEAEEEARMIMTKARQEADLLVSSHDLVVDAQRRANELLETGRTQAQAMLDDAHREAAGLRGEATSQAVEQALEADRYSLDMLRRLDTQLGSLRTGLQSGLEQLVSKVEQAEESRALDQRDAELLAADRERRGEPV